MRRKQKPTIVQLKADYCKHYLLWQLLKESAQAQADHNKEYEERYAKGQQHERASMQQQFRNGILWIIERMHDIEEGLDVSAQKKWIITPAPQSLGKPRCRMSKRLKRLIGETIRELKGRKMAR